MSRKSFASPVMRLIAIIMAALVGWSTLPSLSASADVSKPVGAVVSEHVNVAPSDLTVPADFTIPAQTIMPNAVPAATPKTPFIAYKASGKYLKKVADYKVKLYIPKSKPRGTDLGKTQIIDTRGGSRFVFTALYEKENNYRIRVTLSETGYDIYETHVSNPAWRSEVGAWGVRLNSTWRYLEDTSPKLVYPSVAGKAFYVQGSEWYKDSQYLYDEKDGEWKWTVVDEGKDSLPKIKITAVARTK